MHIFKKIIVAYFIYSFIPILSYASGVQFHEGDSGKDIAQIQVNLKELGYYTDKINGKFTTEMTKAVINFQKQKKLKPDGIVDGVTYLALIDKPLVDKGENSSTKSRVITDSALKLLGVPYKWGGITTKGLDCSGLVWYVFDKNAIHLPRTADLQYQAGKTVMRSNLQQGDLVFFTTYAPGASHTGIYLEKGKFIHASSSRGVMVSNLTDSFWKTRYLGARRII